jgi:putative acyl-CoA dehydrogenase
VPGPAARLRQDAGRAPRWRPNWRWPARGNGASPPCAALLADLAAQGDEYGARRLAERIVVAVQAALLLRHAPPFVAEAFVASRMAQDVGGAFGRLPAGVDCAAILARALA